MRQVLVGEVKSSISVPISTIFKNNERKRAKNWCFVNRMELPSAEISGGNDLI